MVCQILSASTKTRLTNNLKLYINFNIIAPSDECLSYLIHLILNVCEKHILTVRLLSNCFRCWYFTLEERLVWFAMATVFWFASQVPWKTGSGLLSLSTIRTIPNSGSRVPINMPQMATGL